MYLRAPYNVDTSAGAKGSVAPRQFPLSSGAGETKCAATSTTTGMQRVTVPASATLIHHFTCDKAIAKRVHNRHEYNQIEGDQPAEDPVSRCKQPRCSSLEQIGERLAW